MKLAALKGMLAQHPDAMIRFRLPNGQNVAAHAHVTEVAQINKRFIDCGGTLREDTLCRLQTWVAEDFEHRLTAKKLLGILNKADGTVLKGDDMEVDVEHELEFVSQFPLESVRAAGDTLELELTERHTACLAPDKCLPAQKPESILFKPLPLPTIR